ncbi:hypothetical protein CGGC5_v011504 [Colletotrichum fructicola Nara gc5]|uniref:Uncharacterized protein n=1 Tax=Colletotrichum fructicola (strain Nara gc5) TaxID=1213859 RepID=A0A7J6IYR2_COLFN|nr:hypothetical protein CGGC5_v011504 [Colletotrichum fructicola Nara gc5]
MLDSVLDPGTAIPRKVKTLCVDDEPKPKHPDPERQLTWHANLAMFMRHFLRTSNLFIQHLDLCCHFGSLRMELLKAARPQKSLSVMYLRVAHIRVALDFMGPLLKLIKSTASSLCSLAVIFQHSGAALILPDMPSLTTLSLGLEWSKDDPNVLVLPLVTIFSAPTTLKHIFFHVTQAVFESEEEDSDPEDWEALDASIMAMPRLSRIAFVVTLGYSVRDGGESMFFASSERSEEQAREGANNAMRYLEARLPACYEKGIVEVEMTSVSRKFCDDAFLGSDIGPIFWEE